MSSALRITPRGWKRTSNHRGTVGASACRLRAAAGGRAGKGLPVFDGRFFAVEVLDTGQVDRAGGLRGQDRIGGASATGVSLPFIGWHSQPLLLPRQSPDPCLQRHRAASHLGR